MNNLVFNTVASELKTTIYGLAPDESVQALRVDNSGNLLVAGTFTMPDTITVSAIESTVTVTGTVAISNASVTVEVSNASLTVSGEVEITNASITVDGQVEITNASVTVAGTVTVAEISSPVTVTGTVELSNASVTVEVTNASLTVAGTVTVGGTVTVSEISSPVTVTGTVELSNASVTVEVTNASLTVAGTVTVSEITNPVEVSPITIGANAFVEDFEDIDATGTGVIFDNTDISTYKVVSVFIYNLGASTLTLSLQISPSTNDALYIDDPNYSNIEIEPGQSKCMSVSLYAHYFRLQYYMDAEVTSVSAYYIAQV